METKWFLLGTTELPVHTDLSFVKVSVKEKFPWLGHLHVNIFLMYYFYHYCYYFILNMQM